MHNCFLFVELQYRELCVAVHCDLGDVTSLLAIHAEKKDEVTIQRLVEKGGAVAFYFDSRGWQGCQLQYDENTLVKFGGAFRYLRMPVPRFLILATVFFFFKSITL